MATESLESLPDKCRHCLEGIDEMLDSKMQEYMQKILLPKMVRIMQEQIRYELNVQKEIVVQPKEINAGDGIENTQDISDIRNREEETAFQVKEEPITPLEEEEEDCLVSADEECAAPPESPGQNDNNKGGDLSVGKFA